MDDNAVNEPINEPIEPISEPVGDVQEETETKEQQDEQGPIEVASARIVVKRNGAETEDSFAFVAPAIIGRFDPSVGPIDVDLGSLPEGAYVSRKHAKITCEDGVWKIHDLGSSNGTFILRDDFERVEEVEILEGTEIALGNARLVFHLS